MHSTLHYSPLCRTIPHSLPDNPQYRQYSTRSMSSSQFLTSSSSPPKAECNGAIVKGFCRTNVPGLVCMCKALGSTVSIGIFLCCQRVDLVVRFFFCILVNYGRWVCCKCPAMPLRKPSTRNMGLHGRSHCVTTLLAGMLCTRIRFSSGDTPE